MASISPREPMLNDQRFGGLYLRNTWRCFVDFPLKVDGESEISPLFRFSLNIWSPTPVDHTGLDQDCSATKGLRLWRTIPILAVWCDCMNLSPRIWKSTDFETGGRKRKGFPSWRWRPIRKSVSKGHQDLSFDLILMILGMDRINISSPTLALPSRRFLAEQETWYYYYKRSGWSKLDNNDGAKGPKILSRRPTQWEQRRV